MYIVLFSHVAVLFLYFISMISMLIMMGQFYYQKRIYFCSKVNEIRSRKGFRYLQKFSKPRAFSQKWKHWISQILKIHIRLPDMLLNCNLYARLFLLNLQWPCYKILNCSLYNDIIELASCRLNIFHLSYLIQQRNLRPLHKSVKSLIGEL